MRDESDNPTTQMSGQDDTFQCDATPQTTAKKTCVEHEYAFGSLCENSDLKLKNIYYNITPVVVYLFICFPRLNSIEDIPVLVNWQPS